MIATAPLSLRAAVRALGVPWWLTATPPSSTTAGAGLGDEPGAGSVKPPAVVSVATPLDPDDPNDRETVKHICCAMANVSPHATVVADGFGHPLGSGPEFEPVELVKPGQPVGRVRGRGRLADPHRAAPRRPGPSAAHLFPAIPRMRKAPMHIHRWSNKEGTRGRRSFAHIRTHEDGDEIADLSLEHYWASGAEHTGFYVEIGDSGSLKVFVGAAHVFDAWLGVGSNRVARWLYQHHNDVRAKLTDKTVVAVRFHDSAVWWELWQPRHMWTSGTPKWRRGNFNWRDALLGRAKHASTITEPEQLVWIPMPEGQYPAIITLDRSEWKRPRWPWPTAVRQGYDVKILKPDMGPGGYIPIPGKGENSWDCGGDGIFGQSGSCRTVEEAIGHVVASALSTRKRHAGRHDYADPIS